MKCMLNGKVNLKDKKNEEFDFTDCIAATSGSAPKSNGAAMMAAAAASTHNVPPPPPKTEPKYRNDQNVLTSEPTQFNLISLQEAPMGKCKLMIVKKPESLSMCLSSHPFLWSPHLQLLKGRNKLP